MSSMFAARACSHIGRRVERARGDRMRCSSCLILRNEALASWREAACTRYADVHCETNWPLR